MIAKIPTGMSVLLCGVMTGAYGMFVLHISWDTFFESIQKIFVRDVGAILILLFVGVIGEMGLLDILLAKISSNIKHPGILTLFASFSTDY